MNENKMKNIISMNVSDRVDYFIRKVVDFGEMWGLYDSGWALVEESSPSLQRALPVWPEKGFAEICVQGPWQSYHAKQISLNDFLEKWVPGMTKDGTMLAIFPTPNAKAAVVHPKEFLDLMNPLTRVKTRGFRPSA
jgi:hypothetical protein